VLGVRLVLQVAFAPRIPGHVLFALPEAELPAWAAGVGVGGPVTAEALLTACYESLRLIALLAAAGAANSLADPHRLLRSLPSSLHEAGVAVTVALSLAPQAGVAAAQVRDARRLRGRPTRGLAAVRGIALPVLEGALERSVSMAASMDARGFGRAGATDPRRLRTARVAAGLGLLALAVGLYGILDAAGPAGLGAPMLLAGSALLVVALVSGRGHTRRTRYRPDPWRTPEWLTVASGAAVLTGLVVAGRLGTDLGGNLSPLAMPGLPLLPAAAVLLAAAPAFGHYRRNGSAVVAESGKP
jgi:energy-coupling factor transport system permease protein